MPAVLSEILAHKRQEIAGRKATLPSQALERAAEPVNGRFKQSLLRRSPSSGTKLICEIKPASPSSGLLRESIDLNSVVKTYNNYAGAISVLTDRKYFNGSLDMLSQVAGMSPHPVLCKDFILDDYQIYEARRAGAEAVLLIVKILEDRQLGQLHRTANLLGMTAIVEVQNEEETKRALELSPDVLLINNRDLATFAVDLDTTIRLSPMIPDSILTVSASGIQSRPDIERLQPYCSGFLVGSVLMRSEDLDAKLRELSGL